MGEKRRVRIKRAAGWLLSALVLAVNFSPEVQAIRAMPENISMTRGQEQSYSFLFPCRIEADGRSAQVLSDTSETLENVGTNTLTIKAQDSGKSTITLSFLGLIPVKRINVSVYENRMLVPGGMAVGITLRTKGVLVVGLSDVETKGGKVSPAAQGGLRPGDVVLKADKIDVNTTKALSEAAAKAGDKLSLTIERSGERMELEIKPVLDESGIKRLGAWVRDSTAGVGTVTYFDPGNETVGALGHPITDPDTGSLLSVRAGSIYKATIEQVIRGEIGEPGQLCGSFSQSGTPVAQLYENTICGVFGNSESIYSLYPEGIPVALKSEVDVGAAKIISTVEGETMREYDCEIVQIYKYTDNGTKSMLVRITDPRLLSITGGIVQGMSGSPILQNGRIVGAVTHVLINDPTKGYGIFIENMLEAAENGAN